MLFRHCSMCRRLKPVVEFVPKNGKCEPCRQTYMAEYYRQNRERMAAQAKAWREANPERMKVSFQKWRDANPERVRKSMRAADRVRYALKTGRLVKPKACQECGTTGRIQAAHADYSRPLDVRWLCVSCHAKWDHALPKT